MVVDDGQYCDKNMTRIQLYWKNEGWGVCYNLCFPLAQLATTTRNQPYSYSMKTLNEDTHDDDKSRDFDDARNDIENGRN